jgi:thiamine biosynthesis lipoprotein
METQKMANKQRKRGLFPLLFFAFFILLLLLLSFSPLSSQTRYEFSHPQMGTLFQIILYGEDSALVKKAASEAFAKIDSLNLHFSDYLENSEISQLSQKADGHWVKVSSDMWHLLMASQRVSRKSKGAFDITVGPLSKVWRRAFRQLVFPSAKDIQEAKAAVNYRWLKLRKGQLVYLQHPHMRLDAGGIAKGFAVDEATYILQRYGFEQTLVIGGGDLRVGQAPPGKPGWSIGTKTMNALGEVSDTTILLVNVAVSTSGDTYRFLAWEGQRYSHIIDPRTGLGITHRGLTRIQAPTSTLADVLATTVNVLGPVKGLNWGKRHYPQCKIDVITATIEEPKTSHK